MTSDFFFFFSSGQEVEVFPSFVVLGGDLLPGGTSGHLWLLLQKIKLQICTAWGRKPTEI